MEDEREVTPPAPTAPPTRTSLFMRAWLGILLAVAALWLPVDRVRWARATAEGGVFERAEVYVEGEDAAESVASGAPGRRVVQCRYDSGRQSLRFTDDTGLAPGDGVAVAYLPTEPKRAVRAEPGTGALGLYFATESWIVDAALWPIGAVLALASLANLVAMARTPRRGER